MAEAQPGRLRICLIDDDEDEYIITRDLLREIDSHRYELAWEPSFESALEQMREARHDVYLIDYRLGERNGVDLLRKAREFGCRAPALFLTGVDDRNVDVSAMRAGAADYLVKSQLTPALLERSIRYAVEREETLARLNKSHEDLLAVLNELRLGVAMTDRDGFVTFLSESCRQMLQCADDLDHMHWEELCPFDAKAKAHIKTMFTSDAEEREKVSVQMKAPSGQQYWMEVEIKDDPREPRRKIFFLYDMTEVRDLRRLLDAKAGFDDLVGKSPAMQEVYQRIADLAKVDATVLIEGETGTGKELVARAIHSNSARSNKPFIAVNCAGLTESLLASQLFGHRRGAFTGAVEDQLGVFESASGGTVFLDEIGDVSSSVQTSLLRVLQEKEITRLGESRPRTIDARILTATHRDLAREITEGRFRSDLFYRIRVARIQLPPLRDRRVDIPLLVESFLRKGRAATGKQVERVSDAALGALLEHSWPGNVRELQSAVECAVIHCRGAVIQPNDLPPEVDGNATNDTAENSTEIERQRMLTALAASNGNRAEAARLLGISRSTLYRRMSELEIGQ